MTKPFVPDPKLWISKNPRLYYLKPDELILLKRAAAYYLEQSKDSQDLFAWKYVETRMLNRGNLWAVFQAFYWDRTLYMLAEWIPES